LSSSSEQSAPSRNSKSSSTCSRTFECFSYSPCSSPPTTVGPWDTISARTYFSLRIPRSHHRRSIQRSNSSPRLPPYRSRIHHWFHHHRSPNRQVAFQAKEPSRRFLPHRLPSHCCRLGSRSWIPSTVQQEQRRSWYNLQGRAFALGLEDVFCCWRTYYSAYGL
jgi:hypothetical protein